MDRTQYKCCRRGANLRRRRLWHRKIRHSVIFSCSIIAVAVFVIAGNRMIRSGDGRTNKNDVEAGNTYDNAVIEILKSLKIIRYKIIRYKIISQCLMI